MIAAEEKRTFVGSTRSMQEANDFISFKSLAGWQVLVPPFVSAQTLVDEGEETTRPVDSEWTFVLHRFNHV